MNAHDETQADETRVLSDNRRYTVITPNQTVAYNLFRARTLRGLTQEEAAKRLEPFLGVRWSKATFSAAERSYGGDRVRNFTADDIMAFALCFQVPAAFFLLPPEPSTGAHGLPNAIQVGSGSLTPLAAVTAVLVDMERPDAEGGWIGERVEEVLRDTPDDERHEIVRQVSRVTQAVVRTVITEQLSGADAKVRALREVADLLELSQETASAQAKDHFTQQEGGQ